MSQRLDWEKAKRQEKAGRNRPKGKRRRVDRQIVMAKFVKDRKLVCFKCKRSDVFEWAKTGFSNKGPWAICGQCVKKL